MKLVRTEKNGVALWVVETWEREGVFHGFGERTLEGTVDSPGWLAVSGGRTPLLLLDQVHGADFVVVSAAQWPMLQAQRAKADGWVLATGSDVACGIRTADCAPVLIVDRAREIAAALHCGWRGTVAGLLPKAVRFLIESGISSENLEVAIGPCASSCCYEIGPEVGQEFEAAAQCCGSSLTTFPVTDKRGERIFGNLHNLLLMQLLSLGLVEEQIVLSNSCTICSNSFNSYRREPGSSSRQVSFICL